MKNIINMAQKVLLFLLPAFALGIVSASTSEDVIRASPENIDIMVNLLRLFNQRRLSANKDEGEPLPVENNAWQSLKHVGQISGISVDPAGNPVIFHRAGRVWNYDTFDENYVYKTAFLGPIPQDTVITLNPATGSVEDIWGANMFYLPHGLHIDPHGNYWMTDVALHQVIKFQRGSRTPTLVLGQRFEPGSDHDHFCQPTSVAVAKTGEIVVADGYCNSRILVFGPSGNLLEKIPQPGEFMTLRVPHGLTILEQGDVCVADRENMRVICLNAGLGGSKEKRGPPLTIQQPDLGRVFAITSYGNTVYAVNGPTSPMIPIRGFIMNPNAETIFGHWEPTSGPFMNPHAMAISPNGTELYVSEIGPNRVLKFDLVRSKSAAPDPISKNDFSV